MKYAHSLVLVPTYNERDNILRLLTALTALPVALDVLVLDDGSPDGTADLVDAFHAQHNHVSVLRRTGPRGLGRSYVDGYRIALDSGYARAVQLDADLSHDPQIVPQLLQAAQQADVVIGSRYCRGGSVRNWPLHRLLLSRGANLYVRAVLGLATNDATSGFRCYSRRALERIGPGDIVSEGYAFQVEMTYRAAHAGLSVAELPICFTDRRCGASKMSRGVIWESVKMPWRLRRLDLARGRAEEPASALEGPN